MRRREKIHWFGFFEHSHYTLKAVGSIWLVGLKGRTIVDVPTEPGGKPYLLVVLILCDTRETRRADDKNRHTKIIIDTAEGKWQYVKRAPCCVANWPARFRITKQMKSAIDQAVAAHFHETLG